MDMDHGSGSDSPTTPSCKISMLWNWFVVDSCFISTDWHVRSKGVFAASVICLFFLVALIEGSRRVMREYDRRLVAQAQSAWRRGNLKSADSDSTGVFTFSPTWQQQFVRAILFTIQFGAAYIIMLVAMYYNGFMLMAIILGGGFGFFLFGKDTVVVTGHGENGAACC